MAVFFAVFDLRVAILFLALVRISSGQTIPPCKDSDCCAKYKKNLTILVALRKVATSQTKFRYATKTWKQDGTYRFMSFVGGEMPTKKVDENHCGTLHPISLRTPDDTHTCPSAIAAPVTITACVNFNERNVGCFYSFNVGVKFCPGNYFVYYLTPKLSCSIAYCAGKISLRY